MEIRVRQATGADAEICGQICYDAFTKINNDHNFPPDFPSPEVASGFLSLLFTRPGYYAIVAEVDGRIAGSNVLDERAAIAGVGPITVAPGTQNAGVGRALMRRVLDRAASRGAPGVRLVQAAFHNRSLSLYTKLGFDPREPLSCVQGPPIGARTSGYDVRPATDADRPACNAVCMRVHGHTRDGELLDAIAQGSAVVVQRAGRITGYASGLAFFAHAVADTNEDLQALIAAAQGFVGPGILVPTRNAALLRWCLGHGLRIVQPMTLMSLGLYNEPQGAYLPSITY